MEGKIKSHRLHEIKGKSEIRRHGDMRVVRVKKVMKENI